MKSGGAVFIFFYLVKISSAVENCDIRMWYVKMTAEGAFDGDLSKEQQVIQETISDLVIASNKDKTKRKMNCDDLKIFEEILKSDETDETQINEQNDKGIGKLESKENIKESKSDTINNEPEQEPKEDDNDDIQDLKLQTPKELDEKDVQIEESNEIDISDRKPPLTEVKLLLNENQPDHFTTTEEGENEQKSETNQEKTSSVVHSEVVSEEESSEYEQDTAVDHVTNNETEMDETELFSDETDEDDSSDDEPSVLVHDAAPEIHSQKEELDSNEITTQGIIERQEIENEVEEKKLPEHTLHLAEESVEEDENKGLENKDEEHATDQETETKSKQEELQRTKPKYTEEQDEGKTDTKEIKSKEVGIEGKDKEEIVEENEEIMGENKAGSEEDIDQKEVLMKDRKDYKETAANSEGERAAEVITDEEKENSESVLDETSSDVLLESSANTSISTNVNDQQIDDSNDKVKNVTLPRKQTSKIYPKIYFGICRRNQSHQIDVFDKSPEQYMFTVNVTTSNDTDNKSKKDSEGSTYPNEKQVTAESASCYRHKNKMCADRLVCSPYSQLFQPVSHLFSRYSNRYNQDNSTVTNLQNVKSSETDNESSGNIIDGLVNPQHGSSLTNVNPDTADIYLDKQTTDELKSLQPDMDNDNRKLPAESIIPTPEINEHIPTNKDINEKQGNTSTSNEDVLDTSQNDVDDLKVRSTTKTRTKDKDQEIQAKQEVEFPKHSDLKGDEKLLVISPEDKTVQEQDLSTRKKINGDATIITELGQDLHHQPSTSEGKMESSLHNNTESAKKENDSGEKFIDELKTNFDDFQEQVKAKTDSYSNKIQTLELMVMRLENQLLSEKLNKQNHSSSITKLENHILRLENEVLKLNNSQNEIKKERETIVNDRKKYLELSHDSQQTSAYGYSVAGQMHAVSSDHKAKLAYLSQLLKNQSATINQLKSRSEYLEDQNRLLYHMIMNQTALMTQIMTRVQELTEQNIKQRIEAEKIRQEMKEMTSEKAKSEFIPTTDIFLLSKLEEMVSDGKKIEKEINEDDLYVKRSKEGKSKSEKDLEKYMQHETYSLPENWCRSSKGVCLGGVFLKTDCIPFASKQWKRCPDNGEQSKNTSQLSHNNQTINKEESKIDELANISNENENMPVNEAKSSKNDSLPTDKSTTNENGVAREEEERNLNKLNNEKIHKINDSNQQENILIVEAKADVEKEKTLETKAGDQNQNVTANNSSSITENDSQDLPLKKTPSPEEASENKSSNQKPEEDKVITTNDPKDKDQYLDDKSDLGIANNDKTDDTKSPKDPATDKALTEDTSDKEVQSSNITTHTKSEDSPAKKEVSTKQNLNNPGNSPSSPPHQNKENIDNIERGKDKINPQKEVQENIVTEEESKESLHSNSVDRDFKTEESKKENTNNMKGNDDSKKSEQKTEGPVKVDDNQQEAGDNTTKKKAVPKPEETLVKPIRYPANGQREPKDCYDYYKRGNLKNGAFKIKPYGLNSVVEVFCDMKNGGWTVIHKRQDGTTKFLKKWDDYKDGFGGIRGEHWIGNDYIHHITNQDHYKLRIEMTDWNKTKRIAEYDYFMIDNETEGYRLHVGGYHGDAGDGMAKHHNHKFSTIDMDNDKVVKEFGGSCAKRFNGAWWYYKCYMSNLNGIYYRNGKIPAKMFDGIAWKPWTGPNYSLRSAEMKIRPKNIE